MLIKIGCTCMCVCIRRAHVKLIQTGFLLNNFNRNVLLNNILHIFIQVSTTIHERLRQQKKIKSVPKGIVLGGICAYDN